jgi:mRNA interferase MazF
VVPIRSAVAVNVAGAPNSTSGRAASFRSEVEIGGCTTRVLAEQTAAVDLVDAARMPGYLGHHGMRRVDAALRIVLGLYAIDI